MPTHTNRWLTAQETARELDITSAEVCGLLSIGRLAGTKQKTPGRAGKAQWLVDPESIVKEKKHGKSERAVQARKRKRAEAEG